MHLSAPASEPGDGSQAWLKQPFMGLRLKIQGSQGACGKCIELLQFLGLDAQDTETGVGATRLCCQKGGSASCSDPSVEAAHAESGAHLG